MTIMNQVRTFRVIDAEDGGCFNHVRHAEAERDDDPMDVRVEKRRREAEHKRAVWTQNYYRNAKQLLVVPCDQDGNPI